MKKLWRKFKAWLESIWPQQSDPSAQPDDNHPSGSAAPISTHPTGHRASFLFDNAGTRVMNYLSRHYAESEYDAILDRCKANGDNAIYLYLANYGDGAGRTNFYTGAFGTSSVDPGDVLFMRGRIAKARDKGLRVIAWLLPDDSGSIIPYGNIGVLTQYITDAVANFDTAVHEYVLALEADETIKASGAKKLAKVLAGLTTRTIGLHQTPRQYGLSKSILEIDVHYHQYGWGRSPAQIEADTRHVVSRVGKPVIASEYNKSSNTEQARLQGQAAMRGGAFGTGTGR